MKSFNSNTMKGNTMKSMRNTITLAISTLILVAGISAWAGEPQPKEQPAAKTATDPIIKGQRVFSLVHSMAGRFLDSCLDEVAKSAGYKDHTCLGQDGIGRSKVIQHWNKPGVQAVLKAGNVDVLITMGVYVPDPGVEMFAELGVANNPDFRVTFMEMWIPFDEYNPVNFSKGVNPEKLDHNAATGESLRAVHKRYFEEWDDLVVGVNKKLGKQVVFVVPAGQATLALRELIVAGKAPGLKEQNDLFKKDLTGRAGPHPDLPLATLMTYCHYAVIYRKSPVGLPVPSALKLPGKNDNVKELEALNRLLQELAWDAVIHHPLSGVKAGATTAPAAK